MAAAIVSEGEIRKLRKKLRQIENLERLERDLTKEEREKVENSTRTLSQTWLQYYYIAHKRLTIKCDNLNIAL
jgi:hypothetical protein